jgi:hypothetical protein
LIGCASIPVKDLASSAALGGFQAYNLTVQAQAEQTTLLDEEGKINAYWLTVAQAAVKSQAGNIKSSVVGGSVQVCGMQL